MLLQTNTFQCVLATDGSESYVIFLYSHKRIHWSIFDGPYSFNPSHAVAGISAGDGINFNTIPESQTSDIINISETSNVGIPGVWIFQAGKSMLPELMSLPFQNLCSYYLLLVTAAESYELQIQIPSK